MRVVELGDGIDFLWCVLVFSSIPHCPNETVSFTGVGDVFLNF